MKITKKHREEQTRLIIDRNSIDAEFSQADTDELNDVLGTKFESFIRRRNPKFYSDPRHLHGRTFGEWGAFSWRKCIYPSDPVKDAKKVMRESINPALREFRDMLDDPSCVHCGSTSDLTTDHTDPPFDDIANAWITSRATLPAIEDSPDGVGNMFRDMDVEADWITFHASRATYQPLCRACNASKGKTKAVRRQVYADLSLGIDAPDL